MHDLLFFMVNVIRKILEVEGKRRGTFCKDHVLFEVITKMELGADEVPEWAADPVEFGA